MRNRISQLKLACLPLLAVTAPTVLQAADRQIEEVVVTAERKESSVQDTSISITAFTSEMMDDFGIRNQSDLQNMVPATTIQPYDSAVRGVGRNFRNLGGDPGVATYMNGIYSEDLYTATIGSFWDVDRIEVLRGPQGTLYGRNAVGGAMNFIYKRPSDEFEASVKGIVGDYGTADAYAMVSGPLLKDRLNYRIAGSMRNHDGWVKEMSGLGPDLDSGNEDNVAVQLQWFISDNMNVNIRQNVARVDRVMGSAAGAGLVNLSGHFPNSNGTSHDTNALTLGLRRIDPTQADPTQSDFDMRNLDPTTPTYTYTNPTTGATILAQQDRVGVDSSSTRINTARSITYDPASCLFVDRENIKGKDLCAYTNGLNREQFDQQGTQLEFTWDISDAMTFKYLFGYNDLLYERTTDDDNFGSTLDDRQYYVNHEAEYVSHELQLFWDVGSNLTFTSGIFFYDSVIDQRYDFYSATGQNDITNPAHSLDNILATLGIPASVVPTVPLTFLIAPQPIHVLSAREVAEANGTLQGVAAGAWIGGDSLGDIDHGPVTPSSDQLSLNKTERKAMAAYTQGVWNMTDALTLTFGLRWAEDDIKGSEDTAFFAEINETGPLGALGLNLLTANILRGAIDQNTLLPTGLVEPWKAGVPFSLGLHRQVARVDNDLTYRINLDYDINDSMMVYGNVTTGYRSGGFNLAFFSETLQYEPEEITAYELGLKGQFLNNTLQLNGSVYMYDYKSIHTFTVEACPTTAPAGGFQSACAVADSTSSVQAAPGAEVTGFEVEGLWLVTDNLTLGGNFSLTNSEYTKSFLVTDGADPTIPGDIYSGAAEEQERKRDVKGHRLPQVPDTKLSLFGGYEIPINSGRINLLANYSWIDDVYFSAFESELDKAPAYGRIDLRATWTNTNDTLVISGFVNNVADEIGIRDLERFGGSEGYRRSAQVTEPRVYGVEVTYNLR
ncbi:MAG: TonB-dependent receptor [Pseudomonadota bacterium]